LSTIRSADRIYVMNDRTVSQVGTYASLIDVPGVFQELAKRQLI
jgi:ABC-type multidrug transport system fused ATPase/permease subunit